MTWAQFLGALPVLVAFGLGAMTMAVITYGRRSTSSYLDGVREGQRREREINFAKRLAGQHKSVDLSNASRGEKT